MPNIKQFLEKQLLINILIFAVAFIFYLIIPNVDLLGSVNEFKQLSNDTSSVDAILKMIEKNHQQFVVFGAVAKALMAIFFYVIMFTVTYSIYSHKQAQFNIACLSSNMVGINKTLESHFHNYSMFRYYSQLLNAVIHHEFEDALKYDINKIDCLNQDDNFKSTVIFEYNYLRIIDGHQLLIKYTDSLIKASERGAEVIRVFITENTITMPQKEHLTELHKAGIIVKIITLEKLSEIRGLRKDLSMNFIIIDDKEVAFAYPLIGGFTFAVNIATNKDEDSLSCVNDYKYFFDRMNNESDTWSNNLA